MDRSDVARSPVSADADQTSMSLSEDDGSDFEDINMSTSEARSADEVRS